MKKLSAILLAMMAVTVSLSAEDNIPVGTRLMDTTEYSCLQEEREQRYVEADEEDDIIPAQCYFSTHPGAYYAPVAVAADGRTVTLHDGSCWNIRSWDAYSTLDWLSTDTIVILPNWHKTATYQFVLHNLNTGKKCEANLAQGPYYDGGCTHWIVAIDYTWEEIVLEDGSRWDVSFFDRSIMKKWLVNDTVMIGINDSILEPNILINVNMLNYVEAECKN